MIDICFVIFLILMAILGYVKGFVLRLYDLLGTIVVLMLSYFLSKPLSSLIMIYQYDKQDTLARMVGQMVNQILVFVILIIVLTIIKKLLGIVIKPVLKGLIDTFSLTSFVDKSLGVIMSLIEGVFVTYLVLVFIVIPFTGSGVQAIERTTLAKQVVQIVPNVSEQVISLSQTLQGTPGNSERSIENIIKLMLIAKEMNLIDDEQMLTLFQENVQDELNSNSITLTASQKQQLEDMLLQTGYSKSQLQSLLSKINVSDKS